MSRVKMNASIIASILCRLFTILSLFIHVESNSSLIEFSSETSIAERSSTNRERRMNECASNQSTVRIELKIDNYYDKIDTEWRVADTSTNEVFCEVDLVNYEGSEIVDRCCLNEESLTSCFQFTISDNDYYEDGFYYGGYIRLYYKDALILESIEEGQNNFGSSLSITFGDGCPSAQPSIRETPSPSSFPSLSMLPTISLQPSPSPTKSNQPSSHPTISLKPSPSPSMSPTTSTMPSISAQTDEITIFSEKDRYERRFFPKDIDSSDTINLNDVLVPDCSSNHNFTGCIYIPKSTPTKTPYWAGRLYQQTPSCNIRTKECTLGIPMSQPSLLFDETTDDETKSSYLQPINLFQQNENEEILTAIKDSSSTTNAIAVADLNNDGYLDIIVGNQNDHSYVYISNRNSTFTEFTLPQTRNIVVQSIAVADLNNDRKIDIIIGTFNDVNSIFFNQFEDDVIQWEKNDIDESKEDTRSIAVADINHDGMIDIIVGNFGSSNKIYKNQGNHFGTDIQTLPGDNRDRTQAIAVADVNSDNQIDIIVGNNGQNFLLLQDDRGNFNDLIPLSGNDHNTNTVAMGDLNADGHVDIVLGNDGTPNQILINDGLGDFQSIQDLPGDGTTNTASISLADIDNDGYLDIVVGNDVGQNNQLLLNDSTGEFRNPFDLPGENLGTNSIAAGDLDRNGMIEIISANSDAQNEVLWNKITDGYHNAEAVDLISDLTSTFSVSVGDVDGDGKLDIFFGNNDKKNKLLINNGDGSFHEMDGFPSAPNPRTSTSIMVDIDKDGDVDIVYDSVTRQIELAINMGNGMFERKILQHDFKTVSIAAADVDNDGDVDIILGIKDGNKVLMNQGDSMNFVSKNLPGIARTRSIAVADVNNDGLVDIIVGNDDDDNELLLNSGDGEFNEQSLPGGKMKTQVVALSDMNNDGFVDIIIGNLNGQANQLLLNLGTTDGNFADSVVLGGESDKTYAIAVADLDNDGMNDIIVGNKGSKNLILLNKEGTFQSQNLPGGLSNTRSIIAADLNNDGMLDIISGNDGRSHLVPYSGCSEDGAQVHQNSWCYKCPSFMGRHQSKCRECMPDFVQEIGRGEQCNQQCPFMEQRLLGQNKCTLCANGTSYNSQIQRVEADPSTWNMSRCELCELGTYARTELSIADTCIKCRTGSSACERCQSGQYQPDFGQSQCILCDKGGFCTATSDVNGGFTTCRQGTYNDKEGSNDVDACLGCPEGTFSVTVGATSKEDCKKCPVGTFNNNIGQESCKACPLGTYQDETGAKSCIPCPVGKYADKEGLEECIVCPYKLYSDEGKQNCTQCAQDFFLEDVDFPTSNLSRDPDQCKSCPLNAICNTNSTILDIIPRSNYWRRSRNTSTLYFCDNSTAVCQPEYNTFYNRSVGDDAFNDTNRGIYCRKGHTGPLCQVCVGREDHYRNTKGICTKCPDKKLIALKMIGIGIIALVAVSFVGYFFVKVLTDLFSTLSLSAKIKLTVSFFQVLGSFRDVYGIRFHESFLGWFDVFKVLSLDFFKVFIREEQCVGTAIQRLLINATWPYLVVIAGVIILVIFELFNSQPSKSIQSASAALESTLSRLKKRSLVLVIVVFYYTLPIVSLRVSDVIKCRAFETDLDGSTESYMVDDMSIQCDRKSPYYRKMQTVFWIFLTFWSFITPTCFFLLLKSVSSSIQQNRITYFADACRFLWDDYDSTMWFWDVLDTVRRLMLTCFVLLIDRKEGSSRLLRIILAIIVCVLYHTLLLALCPYKRSDNYNLALIMNLAITCCFCLGIILKLCDNNNEQFQVNGNEEKCTGFIASWLDSFRATLLVVLIGVGLLIGTLGFVAVLVLKKIKAPIVRVVKTGYAPNLELPGKCTHHAFISHVWSTGQATTHTIVRKMQLLLPGLKIWLDIDSLSDISLLEECVEQSVVFILFYSSKYFQSKNCRREVYEAVLLDKPIILLHEGGEKVLEEIREECHKYCQGDGLNTPDATIVLQKIFGPFHGDPSLSEAYEATGPIQWLKESAYSAAALNRIYLRIMSHLPHYMKYPKELEGGLTIPGELGPISLKTKVNILICKHNYGCLELAEEIKKTLPKMEASNMDIRDASMHYMLNNRRSIARQSANNFLGDNEDLPSSLEAMFIPTFFLLYLNRFTFDRDDDDELDELTKILKLCLDDTDIPIILINEQDELEGACDFSEYFKVVPYELINNDPHNLFKDIAVPLHAMSAYRSVSFRQILNKIGGQQSQSGKSIRNFDSFLSSRKWQ